MTLNYYNDVLCKNIQNKFYECVKNIHRRKKNGMNKKSRKGKGEENHKIHANSAMYNGKEE